MHALAQPLFQNLRIQGRNEDVLYECVLSRKPTHRVQRGRVDPSARQIKIVANMKSQDLSKDRMLANIVHRDDLPNAAFHGDWRSVDPRGANHLTWGLADSYGFELTNLWWVFECSAMSKMRLRQSYDVRHKLTGIANVDERVLKRHLI